MNDCNCPLHVEGKLGSDFIRKSCKTTDWDVATEKVRRAEATEAWGAPLIPLLEVVASGKPSDCTFFHGSSRGRSGKISEHLAIADLLRMGYEVFQPINPVSPYDLLVTNGTGYLRVEVKTVPKGGRCVRVDMPPKQEQLDLIAMVHATGKVSYHILTPEDKKSKTLIVKAA